MGSTEAEVRLDLALFTARTVAGFLKAASETESGDTRVARLEESVRSLEEERRKIEVFKRELPLCMHLLNDVIKGLEKELEQCRGERYARVFGELIPIGRKFEEEERRVKPERGAVETMKWMSYSQHRIDNSARNDRRDDEIEKVEGSGDLNRKKKENLFLESKRLSGGAFVPFKGPSTVTVNSKEEKLDFPEKSTHASATDSGALSLSTVNDGHRVSSSTSKGVRKTPLKTDDHPSSSQSQHQAPRKVRRCWSPDLHRRFLSALKQLGGVQVATPKQIRELMKVDGLTNDEVKSHLQKYRLHAKKVSTSDLESQSIPIIAGGLPDAEERHSSSSRPSVSQSDSPQSPLQLTLSNTAGNCLEEDGKSESYSWK
ncbi:transcription factor HHO5-like isoform X1 [Zingiber officinale]|uniref:transcription factor HHO5-like isoform X1 n=1 Tax=Zingiber officinale TaxID=94328 RepID=UPI001C4AD8CB|nr:transcription factor HHO5-like isoform X1 [Zingiber officinale]